MDKKKHFISIVILAIGAMVLLAGVIFLIIRLQENNTKVPDGEYLAEIGKWKLDATSESCDTAPAELCVAGDGVEWEFTEIGKGKLTTNNHINDYEFIWAIKDGRLMIETDWLYPLENEYELNLDQNNGIMTLTTKDNTYVFVGENKQSQ